MSIVSVRSIDVQKNILKEVKINDSIQHQDWNMTKSNRNANTDNKGSKPGRVIIHPLLPGHYRKFYWTDKNSQKCHIKMNQ